MASALPEFQSYPQKEFLKRSQSFIEARPPRHASIFSFNLLRYEKVKVRFSAGSRPGDYGGGITPERLNTQKKTTGMVVRKVSGVVEQSRKQQGVDMGNAMTATYLYALSVIDDHEPGDAA